MAKLKIDKIIEAVDTIAYHARKQGECFGAIQLLLESAAELYDEKLNESA